MSTPARTLKLLLQPADNLRLASLCGPMGEHLRQLEARFGIEIRHRGHDFQLIGEHMPVATAAGLLQDMYRHTEQGELSAANVNRFLSASPEEGEAPPAAAAELTLRHARVRTYGANQKRYLEALRDHDLVFGVGPAGTGKTHLAMARAVHALEQEQVRRIVLVRPVVEAGERLGFLPGDVAQKIDPYLRPMLDALDELAGRERAARWLENHIVEIAPLAYMRGRTLNDAFVILDEAQNASRAQMKMLLTRLGFGARTAVTGDLTQTDLPPGDRSGLAEALELLEGLPGVAFVHFRRSDVVRHPLVQQVIEAYARHDDGAG